MVGYFPTLRTSVSDKSAGHCGKLGKLLDSAATTLSVDARLPCSWQSRLWSAWRRTAHSDTCRPGRRTCCWGAPRGCAVPGGCSPAPGARSLHWWRSLPRALQTHGTALMFLLLIAITHKKRNPKVRVCMWILLCVCGKRKFSAQKLWVPVACGWLLCVFHIYELLAKFFSHPQHTVLLHQECILQFVNFKTRTQNDDE